jgi:hypothetical protein
MLPFGVTIPATVPQRSEIPEGLMNYPVDYKRSCTNIIFFTTSNARKMQVRTTLDEKDTEKSSTIFYLCPIQPSIQ